jgi:Asp-tRNA(Asn)/Glu-tRNA(Gln) amidotransferase A subunit family amidase
MSGSKKQANVFQPTRRQFIGAGVSGAALLAAGCAPRGDNINDQLKGAEHILGLQYSDAERDTIATKIDEQLDVVRRLRAINHPNNLPPAQIFDPRLKNKTYAKQQNKITLKTSKIPNIPNGAEDIAFSPAYHLSHWLKSGQISSLEMTKLYLERIEALAPKLECFITVTKDLALSQAAAADKKLAAGEYLGPLHGVPYGLKDLMDTKDIATTWGATTFKDRVATTDAHIVTKLRDAGAVLLGKTTCGAIAWGDVWFGGTTRNPWNLHEGSSGSSAGSASATGAGLVGFSIGTETLGSIVSPSQRCGTTGLRPTFGRVGRTGTMALCWSLDKIGPICRSVEDTALVLSAINGQDNDDPANINHGFNYNGNIDLSTLTLGYDPESFTNDQATKLDKEVLEIVKLMGINIKEISLPDVDAAPLRLQLDIEAAAAMQDLTLSNRDDELRWSNRYSWPHVWRQAHLISAVDLIQIDRLRRSVMTKMDQAFEGVDAIIGPNFTKNMLTITNYTGHPQLSMRVGFQERQLKVAYEQTGVDEGQTDTLPHNISLWSPLFQEGNILAIARAIEEKLGVSQNRPQL